MRVLVTGAAGMLGQALLPALAAAGHEALGVDVAEADVTRLDALQRVARPFRPDWVVHLAAFTKVDDCESQPDLAFLVNGLGARNAALAAAGCGASVLAISTDYVFDGRGTRPYREYDAAAPRSVYGASKWAGERAVREVHPRHVIVRTSWLFGSGGPNFVDTVLARARTGEPLRVVDDQRGSPTLTGDLAQGLLKLMDANQPGTYHCTNSGECTWYDLAAYAVGRAGIATRLERTDTASFPRPAQRPAYSVLSNQFFEHVTGHRLPSWQDAVDRHVRSGVAAR
ncbi:MAG: dTDP-4-dehydrorhamnose reductase [Candidatus Eisenbacteria bacterium]|nr:dTDP-4-dehydrorhamnose reductase [Candidatus Eisenbacteria bacterium]